MANVALQYSYLLNSSTEIPRISAIKSSIFGGKLNFLESDKTQEKSTFGIEALRDHSGPTLEVVNNRKGCTMDQDDTFNEMKRQFLSFKKEKYLENLEHYQSLAKCQTPKIIGVQLTDGVKKQFLVIACADSRVCPSNILGFQPGDAFVVRNVANLVPPFANGPSETKAALEFSVNTLEVPNILVVGHSCCGGINALMSMPDEADLSSFIRSWVITGNNAKLSTKASASNLSFDLQCTHCEKESIKNSMLNLLGYPWIKERVSKGKLNVHGGYYDFVNCTFEKWTTDYQATISKKELSLKNKEFWH